MVLEEVSIRLALFFVWICF
jgi:hypothetical protein